jgi:hypothetical protein
MSLQDKQDKWFQNDTSQTESVWIGYVPKTLDDYERLTKSETESILSEAERIVNGDRQADYSDPVENFKHIADIASAIRKKELTSEDCAVVLMAVKLARENFKHKRDNLVDLAGYTEILYRIKESEVSL